VKTVIVAMLLTTAIVMPASAGSGIKIERPCGTKCTPPAPPTRTFSMAECCAIGTVRFHDLTKDQPSYQSVSRMVIRSSYGTSVIDSTYTAYSR